MEWLESFATANPVAYSIVLISLVAVVGLGLHSDSGSSFSLLAWNTTSCIRCIHARRGSAQHVG
jgi:hypothetical protein